MNVFKKIKEIFAPPAKGGEPLWEQQSENIARQMHFFKDTFRIGILCQFTNQQEHDLILNYKKELDNLGYETEVLMFVNDKEIPRTCFLPNFTLKDINKNNTPYNPRIDRFIKKKFDMLFNFYFYAQPYLTYISKQSLAKCRFGAFREDLKQNSDVFVYTETEDNLQLLINSINEILKKQKYERKQF